MKKVINKLVRDKIPELCLRNGETPETRVITDDKEYLDELCKKLREESAEVTATPVAEELADTLEVLYAIGKHIGITKEQVEEIRVKKAEERGGFEEKIFLISTETNS